MSLHRVSAAATLGVAYFLTEAPMADPNATPWQLPVPRDAVADSAGTSYWSVEDCRWVGVGPAIPDELAEWLAPPIVVGAAPVPTEPPAPSADA
jgi:hypothetical protein